MDQATRNKLQKATQQIRRALESEFSEQLEGTFDILSSGKILPEPGVHLSPAQRLIRQKLVDSITHNQASGKSVSEAIQEYTREAAFTFLNRFVALRMLEARGILLECVSKGDQSSGFKEFTGLAAGLASLPDGGYRLYLECLCDELSVEVKVLFDRRDPAGLLWPRRNALNEILETLGQADLAAVWKEDETIGWVYQYFNSSEERKQMRDESAAPRNSRELAVRNQFFTPRYVVEFLTDNTLGRIWYEMRQGQTVLKETCKYLVRRPSEVFLDDPDAYQERDSRPWVKKVRSGDFSDLPDDPTESELASISLCFNGYDIVENLGTYGTFQESVETWLEEFEKTGKAPNLTLELWLMLFYKQRVWRHVYQSYPAGPEFIEQWRQLYLLWRESLLKTDELSQEELLKKPVFVPFRQIKDPREIRVLDPASGSGHFLLYSFDLLWEIYLEAWECGSVKSEDFGNRQLPFVEFDSVRFNPGAQVKSNLTHDFISPDDALVVAWDRKVGEPKPVRQWLVTNSAMLNRLPDKLTSYPLKEFNFSDAIKQGLLKKEDAAKLIHETGCWSFSGIPVRTSEEAFAEYKRQIPAMILAHNLHGIDIDLRATQIASLALWMRAQRAFQEMKLPVASRPAIRRSNIVCAEPMPGEARMLDEFANQLNPPVLGQLVRVVFDKMKLAGEAGSLLKIEEEIRDAVDTARQQFGSGPVMVQTTFFDVNTPAPRQQRFDLSGVRETEFFEQAEALVLDALRLYAEQAQTSQKTKRRLFAQDAARGFAFIDLCRKRYDVALMNPPFGDSAKGSKRYIEEAYEHSASDILHAFVERGLSWLILNGREGVISARTGFFLGNSKDWRKKIVFQNRLACFADLGLGVLDDALVEVAAYVIERGKPNGGRVYTNRQLDTREKEQGLLSAIQATVSSTEGGLGLFDQSLLGNIPDNNFAYWSPAKLLKRYAEVGQFGEAVSRVRQGVATADDFRFARLGWEVASEFISLGRRWQRFSKGGEYSPPYDDIHLLVDWGLDGVQLKAFAGCFIRNESFYFKAGATYTVRTASAFAGKVLPAGCIFSHNAQSWFSESNDWTLLSVGYLSCRVPQAFLELAVGSGDIATAGSAARRYTTAVVESVPAGLLTALNNSANLDAISSLYRFRVSECMSDESSCHFSKFHILSCRTSLCSAAEVDSRNFVRAAVEALDKSALFDQNVTEAFALSVPEAEFVNQEVGLHPTSYKSSAIPVDVARLFHLDEVELMAEAVSLHGSKRWFTKKSYFVDRRLEIICHLLAISPSTIESLLRDQPITDKLDAFARNVISEAIGSAFGRWDIRYATGEKVAPELPDPFAPLPVCPPGQLQNEQGLPAGPGDVPEGYPVPIPWDGILVDDPNHPADIVARSRQVMELIWHDKAADIEHEAAEILGVRELRDYFRKSAAGGFWPDHIKRYSKSRRKAPIYWQLATASGTYSVWLYYHRFTSDTFFKILNEYARPKLAHERQKLDRLKGEFGAQPTRSQQKELETQESLIAELAEFTEEIQRVAPLWRPNLNDGVIINFAPLWRLVPQNKPWQKECKACWDSLVKGEYDWSHLAMHLWPERVVPKCQTDASLAIAHGLEAEFWQKDARDRYQPKPAPECGWEVVVKKLVAERQSPAVKASVESLMEAPVSQSGGKGGRKRKGTA